MIIKVKNIRIEKYNDLKISLKHDALASTFSVNIFVDNNNKHLFKPLSYNEIIIERTIEGRGSEPFRVFTGIILNHTITVQPVKSWLKISGYSLPGILEDCQIPPTDAHQFDGLRVVDIIRKVIRPFRLNLLDLDRAQTLVDEPLSSVNAEIGESVKSFITKIAERRNYILTHNRHGYILLRKSADFFQTWTNRVNIFDGKYLEAKLTVSGQKIHTNSYVVGQENTELDISSKISESKNQIVDFETDEIYRPIVNKSDTNDYYKATPEYEEYYPSSWELKKELKNIVLNIKLSRITVGLGIFKDDLMLPFQPIVVTKEEFGMTNVDFVVRSVDYLINKKQETCTISCVLAECFDEKLIQDQQKNIFS